VAIIEEENRGRKARSREKGGEIMR